VDNRKEPNRLLRAMIVISFGIHLAILAHIARIYRSESLTYIELAVQDLSKPVARSIPRPRVRQHEAPEIKAPRKLTIRTMQIPDIRVDPVQTDFSNTLMERIESPQVPRTGGGGIDVSGFQDTNMPEYLTKDDYFEMLRLKIERYKKYPVTARERQIEGKVVVRFSISSDGRLSSLGIANSSRHDILDQAALKAVEDAAPFSQPPSGLFIPPLRVEIAIVFELT
jgi:periplasmic protein TonB